MAGMLIATLLAVFAGEAFRVERYGLAAGFGIWAIFLVILLAVNIAVKGAING